MSDDEKRFEPSEQKRERFRDEGRFARAKDLGGLACAASLLGVLVGTRASFAASVTTLFRRTLGDPTALERTDILTVLGASTSGLLVVSAGAVGLGAVVATTIGLVQSGFRLYPGQVGIKFERLDPMGALQKIFSPMKAGGELGLSLVRLLFVGLAGYRGMSVELPTLLGLARLPLAHSLSSLGGSFARVLVHIVGALLVASLIEYGWSWYSLEKEMRMSYKERRDEARQQDGDPKAKQRMRSRSRAIMRQRSLQSVKGADVVVTNPTHLSVALRYGAKDAAPTVVTKGEDDHALEIRRIARKHGIPILENRPLARALYAEVQVGKPIPASHFVAVAHVLALVYRLKKKGALRAG